MAQRLRILIDPLMKERYGPEVFWVWRLSLSSIGYAWGEVSPDAEDCDVAYLSGFKGPPAGKLVIFAEPDRWDEKSELKLVDVKTMRP